MLPGLGHHAFFCGDNQKGQVNGTHASQHVLDEPLVARHVNDADLASAGQRHPGKAQVNGHLSGLLFGKAVGVDTS